MRINPFAVVTCLLFAGPLLLAAPIEVPKAMDDRLTVELFAAEPDIVTPVNLAVDRHGHLLAIENHTHFRPADYAGPATDRIRVVQDTDHDGKADLFTTFYEGSVNTMNIVVRGDWVYVVTRSELFRLRDVDGDHQADERQDLVGFKTPTDYPHNGLSGLDFGPDGLLYFSLGENFGGDYRLTGSDSTALSGSGEGGSVFRCTEEGTHLERFARGFWNPFGLCFDRAGRLFAVDNDPGSRPPCRLLHVVPGGDYGFRFKYGGNGTSALVAWNGELPGTLGMASITGEGPCKVIVAPAQAVPNDVADDLLVAAWGSHRIERYTLKPKGASFIAERKDLVVGGPDFRPVGMTIAPDGWIYFSDWVRFDYATHRQGRIWRMRWDAHGSPTPVPVPTVAESRATGLRRAVVPLEESLAAMEDGDPFIRQAAVHGLSGHDDVMKVNWADMSAPSRRLGVVLALWRSGKPEARAAIPAALADPDIDVRLAGIRWVADESLSDYRDAVEQAMSHPRLSGQLFSTSIAALDSLDRLRNPSQDPKPDLQETLLSMVFDDARDPGLRLLALRSLPARHPKLNPERLSTLLRADHPALASEVVRTLAERDEAERFPLFAAVVQDTKYPPEVRAEAIVGLAADAENHVPLLSVLAADDTPVVRDEAVRALRLASLTEAQRTRLPSLPKPQDTSTRPPVGDTEAWLSRLAGESSATAGRRVFFHPRLGGCYRCHRLEGRGAPLGPDLTQLARSADRRAILESILQPGKEVAPQYVTWSVTTRDGRNIVGFHAGENNPAQSVYYMDLSGLVTEVKESEMVRRTMIPTSIMPEGLAGTMTDREIRDLLAYLTQAR